MTAALDSGDFATAAASVPSLMIAARTTLEIFREEEDNLDEDVFWGAKRALAALRSFMTAYKKATPAAAATTDITNG